MNLERPDKIALDFKTAHTHSMCLKEGNFRKIEMDSREIKILVARRVKTIDNCFNREL